MPDGAPRGESSFRSGPRLRLLRSKRWRWKVDRNLESRENLADAIFSSLKSSVAVDRRAAAEEGTVETVRKRSSGSNSQLESRGGLGRSAVRAHAPRCSCRAPVDLWPPASGPIQMDRALSCHQPGSPGDWQNAE